MSRIEEIRQRNEAEKKLLAGKFPEEKRHVSDIEYLLEELDALRWIVMNPGAADSLRRGLDQLAARTVIQGVTDNHSAVEPEPHAEGTF
jgi:Trm5-related predicted tRNA methylase